MPLVSIIITSFNYAHTIGDAIRSVLVQDYPNTEILVMDNASTDGTAQVVQQFSDSRILFVRRSENIGMVPNHNAAICAANGEYVAFLSADDIMMPGFISRSVEYLRANPSVDVKYGSTYFCDLDGNFTGVRQMTGQPLCSYTGGRDELAGLLAEGCYMCFPTMLMRKSLFERFGELDEEIIAADYEIVMRWADNGVRFAYDPEPVIGVRLHPTQVSSFENYGEGDLREVLHLVRKFATPKNEHRLRGFENRIKGHIGTKYAYAAQRNPEIGADSLLIEQINECGVRLEEIRRHNLEQPHRVKPCIVVLAGENLTPLQETLQSVIDRPDSAWEAIVVQNPGPSLGPLCWHMDPQGRIRHAHMTRVVHPGERLHQAMRISAANEFAFVRAGSRLAESPRFFAREEAAHAVDNSFDKIFSHVGVQREG